MNRHFPKWKLCLLLIGLTMVSFSTQKNEIKKPSRSLAYRAPASLEEQSPSGLYQVDSRVQAYMLNYSETSALFAGRYGSMKSRLEQRMGLIVEVKSNFAGAEEKLRSLAAELANHKDVVEKKLKDISDKAGSIAEAVEQTKEYQEKADARYKELVAEINGQSSKLKELGTQLSTSVESLKSDMSTGFSEQKKQLDEMMGNIKVSFEGLQSIIEANQVEIKNNGKEIETAKQMLDTLEKFVREQAEKANVKGEDLERLLQGLALDALSKREALDALSRGQGDIKALISAHNEKLQGLKESFDKILAEKNTEIEELKVAIGNRDIEIGNLKKEIESLQANISTLTAERDSARSERDAHAATIEKLKEQLGLSEAEVAECKKAVISVHEAWIAKFEKAKAEMEAIAEAAKKEAEEKRLADVAAKEEERKKEEEAKVAAEKERDEEREAKKEAKKKAKEAEEALAEGLKKFEAELESRDAQMAAMLNQFNMLGMQIGQMSANSTQAFNEYVSRAYDPFDPVNNSMERMMMMNWMNREQQRFEFNMQDRLENRYRNWSLTNQMMMGDYGRSPSYDPRYYDPSLYLGNRGYFGF